MNKTEIEEIKDVFNSIICLAVEGVEVIRPMIVIDKIAKEAERGCGLADRHLTSHAADKKCQCRFSDAWRCAKDQNLTNQVACHCSCHSCR